MLHAARLGRAGCGLGNGSVALGGAGPLDGELEEPGDQQRLTHECEGADGQGVAGDEDPSERIREIPGAGEDHESTKKPREVRGPVQQATEADEMKTEDRKGQVPAVAKCGDGCRGLRVELV